MAGATTIFLIFLTINIGMLFFGFESGGTYLGKLITGDYSTGTIATSPDLESNISNMLLGAIVLSTGAAITVGLLIGRENGMYAGFVTFLLQFAFTPISIFTMVEIPILIKAVIGIPLVVGYIFALIGFFRGYQP
jgi:hypothetical protein